MRDIDVTGPSTPLSRGDHWFEETLYDARLLNEEPLLLDDVSLNEPPT